MVLKKINAIFNSQESRADISTMSKEPSEVIELEDRDPNDLTRNLEVGWDEIIGENKTLRSPECAWSVSNQCFKYSRNGCYICLSVIIAPIFAFLLGLLFAILTFLHIWLLIPVLRIWKILFGVVRSFITSFTYSVIIPISTAFGHCLSEIRIKTQRITLNDEIINEKRDDIAMI